MTGETSGNRDPEFVALATVFDALQGLNAEAQERVIDYVIQKLGLGARLRTMVNPSHSPEALTDGASAPGRPPTLPATQLEEGGLEGISALAKKWMTRSGLNSDQLSRYFSLGADEIDLVAKNVPGKSKRERMRSVLLLKAIAAYLSNGVARVTH